MPRKRKGYNYILLRMFTYPLLIYKSKSKDMYKVEGELHKMFKGRRFDMSETRAVLKSSLTLIGAIVSFFCLKEFEINIEKNICFILVLCSLFLTFDIKLGVTNDIDRRLREIRDDLNSGHTEWFRLNLYQLIASIIYTEARNKPFRLLVVISLLVVSCTYIIEIVSGK